jgi:putrescine aminotransferase
MTSASNSTSGSIDARLSEIDAAHHLHPFTNNRHLRDTGGPLVIERGEGCQLWDAQGRQYLDAMAGLWCVNVGYGREELVRAAADQMSRLPYYKTFFNTTMAPTARLAERLVQLTPDGLNHVLFANSGSEAIDSALRMVRQYWNLVGRPEKSIIIGRDQAYHGSTLAAASVGGILDMHVEAGLPLDGFAHVEAPYQFFNGADMTEAAYGRHAAYTLEAKINELGADKVAAFFAEPVQGAGGVIIPPDGYFDHIQEICQRHDVLLVIDEVVCGFGRLGAWTGSELFGIQPDMMTLAKGLSSGYQLISALMVGDRIADALLEAGSNLSHGFTYSGHPVCAAVALANLDIIEREKLVERTRNDTGPYPARRLSLLADHPLVGEVRSRGLIAAVEIVQDKANRIIFDPPGVVGAVCRDQMHARGVIVRPVRDAMIIAPPLTVSYDEIDRIIEALSEVLDLIQEELGLVAAQREVETVVGEATHPLADLVAVVTGALRGIGSAVAKRYAAEGATVYLVGRDGAELRQTATAISDAGGSAHAVVGDVNDPTAMIALAEQIRSHHGRLDILVANAAVLGDLAPLHEMTDENWDLVIATNLTSGARLIQTFDSLLRLSSGGRVVFVTSGAATGAPEGFGAYGASKAGMEAIMRGYAAETRSVGLCVNAVDPGEVRTAMRSAAAPGEDAGRLPSPEHITDVFVQLAAPACNFTGTIIPATVESDGG